MNDGAAESARATDAWARPLDLNRALKMLKRTFENDVRPSVRRHQYYVGPGERRRLKERSARKRVKKAARKRREAEAERLRLLGPAGRD